MVQVLQDISTVLETLDAVTSSLSKRFRAAAPSMGPAPGPFADPLDALLSGAPEAGSLGALFAGAPLEGNAAQVRLCLDLGPDIRASSLWSHASDFCVAGHRGSLT